MLELKGVKKTYKTKSGEVNALNGIDLVFPSTGLVFITGKSGCGKTTLLNVIGGLDGIDGGDISVFGKPFSSFSQSDYDDYRNTFIGFIFQEYNLLPEFTVEKNIRIAMELQGSNYDQNEFNQLLETVEISDLINRKPNELSGGQRQRVAIARALIKSPRIIMADEPTGALDSKTGVQVFDILKKLSKDKLIIVVSHDLEFAKKYADRIISLVDGKVVEDFSYDEKEVQFNVKDEKDLFLVRDGADLSDREKDALALAVKNRKKIKLIEKLTYRDKKPTGKVETLPTKEPIKLKKSKMKFESALALGVKSLGVKPLRLIITILLSAIAFAVFGLFDTVANFSTAKVLSNVLRNSPYPSITTYGQYVLDKSYTDTYDIKVSEEKIEELSSKTGFTIKGVYNFNNNSGGYINQTYPIAETLKSTVTAGKDYYTNNFSGVVEFSQQEFNENNEIKGFGYKLVKGVYPTTIYPKGDSLTADIAISTYMADSIFHYLNGELMNDYIIEKPEDLLNKSIKMDNMSFKIVGFISCGEIPEKYNILKEATPNHVSLQLLIEDYVTYINSGAHKYIFAPQGFKDYFNSDRKIETLYFSGDSAWTSTQSDDTTKYQVEPTVYSVDDFTQDNILLFSNEYSLDNKVTLKDDEVLIHVDNIKYLYYERYYKEILKTDVEIVNNSITNITNMENNTLPDKLDQPMYTIAEKRVFLQEMLDVLCTKESDYSKTLTITKKSNRSQREITKNVKVVGIYFDIEPSRTVFPKSRYRLMMNKNLMQDFEICTEQGDYSRLLIMPKTTSFLLFFKNASSINILSDYMTSTNGFALNWYGNSTINLIKENENTIRQSADLFLYVSLVLALFSMFMFFNYIATSIVNKRPSIGVLRGLGSGRKDILRMFICESIIIAIINAVLATVLTAVGCIFVNMYLNNVMNIAIPFAIFSARQALIIFGASIITAIVSSTLPIIKISREKPVDLIRKP